MKGAYGMRDVYALVFPSNNVVIKFGVYLLPCTPSARNENLIFKGVASHRFTVASCSYTMLYPSEPYASLPSVSRLSLAVVGQYHFSLSVGEVDPLPCLAYLYRCLIPGTQLYGRPKTKTRTYGAP